MGYRTKLSQEVSDGILEMIYKSKLPPGSQLPTENELAKIFEVSRTAVREGVKSLVAIGILETRQGLGTFIIDSYPGPLRHPNLSIASLDRAKLIDLLEFRLILEPEIAALAAIRRSDTDLEEMERCVKVLEGGFNIGEMPPEDIGFHRALTHATHNSALKDTLSFVVKYYASTPYPTVSTDPIDHRAIYEAVKDGNTDAARERMKAHIKRTIEQLEKSKKE